MRNTKREDVEGEVNRGLCGNLTRDPQKTPEIPDQKELTQSRALKLPGLWKKNKMVSGEIFRSDCGSV